MLSLTITTWKNSYESLQLAIEIGQKSLEKGTAYIYRVGSVHFEAAFASYLTQAESEDWEKLFQEALRLFALSEQIDDCRSRKNYPFNLARLHIEWYLGQWLLEKHPDPVLLDRSINLYVDGIWGQDQQPLAVFSVLPMGYLLRQDGEQLEKFWEILAKQIDLSRLPDELALWYRWSQLLKANATTSGNFFGAYDSYCHQLSGPTIQPAKFYMAAAKIGQQSFGLTDSRHSILYRLAVEPWDTKPENTTN